MTGGAWTLSIKMVHGPGSKRGSMDPWFMFCPHPNPQIFLPKSILKLKILNPVKSFDCCCHLKSTVFPLGSTSKIKRIKNAKICSDQRYL